MTERLNCEGEQIRQPYYFEYPSVVAMMLRLVRYGIVLGFNSIEIDPLDVSEYSYHIGHLHIDFSSQTTVISLPWKGLRSFALGRQCPNAAYEIQDLTNT